MITRSSARLQKKNNFYQMHYKNVVDTCEEKMPPRRSQRIEQKKRDKKYNEKKQLQIIVNVEPKAPELSPKTRTKIQQNQKS